MEFGVWSLEFGVWSLREDGARYESESDLHDPHDIFPSAGKLEVRSLKSEV